MHENKFKVLDVLLDTILAEHNAGVYGDEPYLEDILEHVRQKYVLSDLNSVNNSIKINLDYDINLIEKIGKIKALVDGGVGGEKAAAEVALNKIMKANNIHSLEDLYKYDSNKEYSIENIVKECLPASLDTASLSKIQMRVITFYVLLGINEAIKAYKENTILHTYKIDGDTFIYGMFAVVGEEEGTQCYTVCNDAKKRFKENASEYTVELANNLFWEAATETFSYLIESIQPDTEDCIEVPEVPEVNIINEINAVTEEFLKKIDEAQKKEEEEMCKLENERYKPLSEQQLPFKKSVWQKIKKFIFG